MPAALKYPILGGALAVAAIIYVCQPKVTDVTVPAPMQQFYLANGWIPLPMPDSRMAPGVIVEVVPGQGISFISNLKTCGVPDDVLKPVPGTFPKLTFSTKAKYDAKAVLGVEGVQIGPEFSKVKNVGLEQDNGGSDAIDSLGLQIWYSKPENASKFPQTCTDFLNAPNHYIIRESYRISKGKYTLYGENNAKINLKGLSLGPIKISPDVSASVTADGALEFESLEYTAIRRLRKVAGNFQTLGKPGQPEAADDDEVKSMLGFSASK
jgi:hypothetical protein